MGTEVTLDMIATCAEFINVDAKLKHYEERAGELKALIREGLTGDVPGAIVDGRTTVLNVGARSVRVTHKDAPPPAIQPEVLRKLIGDELFHEVCRVKAVEFDVSLWTAAVAQERATHEQLTKSLGEQLNAPKGSVSVGAAKKAK